MTTTTDDTKGRLLEAAGEEFAVHGFDAARIRRICARAEANVASVNYHFGDKGRLYVEAVLEAHRCNMKNLPGPGEWGGSPAEQLRLFIHSFLSNVLAISREPNWHDALMLREMLNPTPALEAVIKEAIRPRFERLTGVLQQICPAAGPRRIHALAFSVIGQCLHYKMGRPVSERLIGREAYETLDLEFLTDHITGFSLAALGQAPPFDDAGEPGRAGPSKGSKGEPIR